MEFESSQHHHSSGDARDRHDPGGGAFQFARSRTPWIAALFLFRIALLRSVSSKTSFSSRGYSSDHTSTGLSSDDFSVSRRSLGYLVSGDLSQSATLRHGDWHIPSSPGFSRNPLPRRGG